MAIRVIKNPPVAEEEFDLIGLTREEALVLSVLVGNVWGSSRERRICDRIYNALQNQGISGHDEGYRTDVTVTVSRSI